MISRLNSKNTLTIAWLESLELNVNNILNEIEQNND